VSIWVWYGAMVAVIAYAAVRSDWVVAAIVLAFSVVGVTMRQLRVRGAARARDRAG
jgi:hypothetical protein